MKEQKKNKGSVLVAESAYNAQNAQFGLLTFLFSFFTLNIETPNSDLDSRDLASQLPANEVRGLLSWLLKRI